MTELLAMAERLERVQAIGFDAETVEKAARLLREAAQRISELETIAKNRAMALELAREKRVAAERALAEAQTKLKQLGDTGKALTEESVARWVPVSERLPTHIHSVLIRVAADHAFDGYTEIGIYNDTRGKWQIGADGGIDVDVEVTHWMPLPSPPKDGLQGKPGTIFQRGKEAEARWGRRTILPQEIHDSIAAYYIGAPREFLVNLALDAFEAGVKAHDNE